MARYDKLRKLDRNLAVLRYRQNNPGASFQEIADVFNLGSRCRAFQICRDMAKRQVSIGGQ